MAVSKIICMKDEDFRTMATQGYVVVDGVQINYSGSNLYFTDYISADMVDDTNAGKKFLTPEQAELMEEGVQPELVGSGTGQNIKTVNGQNIMGPGDIPFNEMEVLTTAPTEANTSGKLKFVYLQSEPTYRYSGYIYLVSQS